MKTFPGWARFVAFFVVTFTAGQVAQWLPLTPGWTLLAAGGIAGTLGFMLDLWDRRRDSPNGTLAPPPVDKMQGYDMEVEDNGDGDDGGRI